MKRALIALNTIEKEGVINRYAIGGAIGASYYIEATATEDIDAFVFLQPAPGSFLISLSPIYDALVKLGGIVYNEHIKFGNWPVQVLPAYKPLVEDALNESIEAEFDGVPTRIFTPEYTCAIALDTGRIKDYYRVSMFIEQQAVDMNILKEYVVKYGLEEKVKNVTNWVDRQLPAT